MPRLTGKQVKNCLFDNLLIILTLAGVASGIGIGLILRSVRDERWSQREIMYIAFIGEIFLSMLKSLILPLIVSSIISAIGSLDLSLSGKIGMRAIVYYLVTTVSAIIMGMVLTTAIHPGKGDATDIPTEGEGRNVTTPDTLMDLVRKMFPPNLVQACIEQPRTVLYPPEDGSDVSIEDWDIKQEFDSGMNILGLVVFAVVFGITLAKMKADGAPLLNFFTALGSAMMIITNWVIWLSPLGVCFLIIGKVLEMDSLDVIAGQLGMYTVTVIVGLLLHGFIVLPIYYTIMTKTLPFKYILNMGQALATAFGTGSSNATLPVAMSCLENKNKLDSRVVRFVMPIGATINMDGTALYEAVAAIFISQVRGITLSIGQLIAVSVTATAASIGAAGIPQAGLVTMVMVLDVLGLPAEDVTLVLAVDWLLDRFRTAINVLGDSLGAGIVNHLSQGELAGLGDFTGNQKEECASDICPSEDILEVVREEKANGVDHNNEV